MHFFYSRTEKGTPRVLSFLIFFLLSRFYLVSLSPFPTFLSLSLSHTHSHIQPYNIFKMSLWADKYRPTTLDQLTYHKGLTQQLKQMVYIYIYNKLQLFTYSFVLLLYLFIFFYFYFQRVLIQ